MNNFTQLRFHLHRASSVHGPKQVCHLLSDKLAGPVMGAKGRTGVRLGMLGLAECGAREARS